MPRLTRSAPKYRKHRHSGQAVVTLAGKDHYLGKYGTKASKQLYDRLVGEWLASGRPSFSLEEHEITVAELILAYWKYAKQHYRRADGVSTGTAERMRYPLRTLRQHYGDLPVSEFGPLCLKHLQQIGIESEHARTYINDNISRILSVFKWGVSEELLDESVYRRLATVRNLQRGKSGAKEKAPIKPVDDETVERTLVELNEVVADMVRVQRLTGARPGEICVMRAADIDCSGEIWVYQPIFHKTEHHGIDRVIAIGPRAQVILSKYMDRPSTDYFFKPEEGNESHLVRQNERRVTPRSCGTTRCKGKSKFKATLNECYSVDSYRRAIHRACDRAFPLPASIAKKKGEGKAEHNARLTAVQAIQMKEWLSTHRWSPNQLRHTMATVTRQAFGIEGVVATLGHRSASTSEIYAERNVALAAKIASEIG